MGYRQKTLIIGITLLAVVLASLLLYYFKTRPQFTKPIEASMDFGQEIYHIGDEMVLQLTVLTRPGYSVQLPEITPPEEVNVIKKGEIKTQKNWGFCTHTASYQLSTFEPGEYIFPRIIIPYITPDGDLMELEIDGPTLLVESLLSSEAKDIRGLKPLVKSPGNYLIYYFIGGGLVLIILLLIILWYRRKRSQGAELKELPPLPAHVIAYQRLAYLETADLIEEGQIDKYFTVLSEIVREYIENRFAVKAREMTTEEFLEQALSELDLIQRHQDLLRDFLQHADLVKYARHIPGYEQIHQAFLAARHFVDETKIEENEEGGKEVV